jgi:hypothetical protein
MITLQEGALKLVHEHFLSGISEGKPAFLEEKQFTDPSMLSPKQRRNIGRRGIQHVINEWSLTIGALHESEQGIEKKKGRKDCQDMGNQDPLPVATVPNRKQPLTSVSLALA